MVRRGAPGGEARVVSAEARIEASATRVWEVLSDFAAIEAWSPVVLRSFSTTEANGGIGAARHCDLFPRGSVEEQIVDWEPGERLSFDDGVFSAGLGLVNDRPPNSFANLYNGAIDVNHKP